MTRDKYFEMCEALQSAPKDDEIPVEFIDFPVEVQEAINVYSMLNDTWDHFNNRYTGKSYVGFGEVCGLLDIHDKDSKKFIYEICRRIDKIQHKILSSKRKNAEKQQKPPK